MERFEKNKWKHCMHPDFEKQQKRGRIAGGLIAVTIGAVLLAKQLGVVMPGWLFTWPMILIAVGIFVLAKHGFQRPGGLIPLTVGAVFLIEKIMPGEKVAHYIWPALIILFGLFMIMSPWSRWRRQRMERWHELHTTSTDDSNGDFIDVDTVFGGVEKNVISKNFQGGKVNCVFGGTEINLLNADISGPVTLEIHAVFGGVDLTVPAHWKIKTEISAMLGGVEDKRPMNQESLETQKVLILKGSVVFGGISIKGY